MIPASIARDRVVGVLLGLLCMWLVFDRLWVRDAPQEMQDLFSRNLQELAEFIEPARKPATEEVARRALQLRDQINDGFNAVKAQSDAVLFEFGPSRERKLKIRDDIRRWQPGSALDCKCSSAACNIFTRSGRRSSHRKSHDHCPPSKKTWLSPLK
jgi:hypothetical protein